MRMTKCYNFITSFSFLFFHFFMHLFSIKFSLIDTNISFSITKEGKQDMLTHTFTHSLSHTCTHMHTRAHTCTHKYTPDATNLQLETKFSWNEDTKVQGKPKKSQIIPYTLDANKTTKNQCTKRLEKDQNRYIYIGLENRWIKKT